MNFFNEIVILFVDSLQKRDLAIDRLILSRTATVIVLKLPWGWEFLVPRRIYEDPAKRSIICRHLDVFSLGWNVRFHEISAGFVLIENIPLSIGSSHINVLFSSLGLPSKFEYHIEKAIAGKAHFLTKVSPPPASPPKRSFERPDWKRLAANDL